MSHFAEIDENGLVKRVIVITQEEIDTGNWGNPTNWINTSYNTQRGIHNKGGISIRKNFAGIGYTYDKVRDIFIPPNHFNSWVLNEETGIPEPPTPRPQGKAFMRWNENNLVWE